MYRKILFALLAAFMTILTAGPALAVVNGRNASTGEAPFVAQLAIGFDNDGNGQAERTTNCTGTLVHPSYVLTAAHCVVDPGSGGPYPQLEAHPVASAAHTTARIGNTTSGSGGDLRNVAEIIVHPDFFVRDDIDDLALLRLTQPSWQARALLGEPDDRAAWGTYGPATTGPSGSGQIYGWGATQAWGAGGGSTTLRTATIRIEPDPGADEQHDIRYIGSNDPNARGACIGDDGGPLLVTTQAHGTRLVGVAGYQEQRCGGNSAFSEVGAGPGRDWVHSHIPDIDNPPVDPRSQVGSTSAPAGASDFEPDDTRYEEPSGGTRQVVATQVTAEQAAAAESAAADARAQSSRDVPVTVYDPQAYGALDCYTHHDAGTQGVTWSYYPQVEAEGLGTEDALAVFGAGNAFYVVRPNGDLVWQQRDAADCAAPPSEPRVVGVGWDMFSTVFAMESSVQGEVVIYGITPAGDLYWYAHRCAATGGGLSTSGCWAGGNKVGTGWNSFLRVFPGGGGVIYAIAQDGTLWWYSHSTFADGRALWAPRQHVGDGWQNFHHVFSGTGNGVIYAATQDGELLEYQHLGFARGTYDWTAPASVGSGWYQDRTFATI